MALERRLEIMWRQAHETYNGTGNDGNWVLLGFTVFYGGFTGFYWVILENSVSPGFTGFHRVLRGFTGL